MFRGISLTSMCLPSRGGSSIISGRRCDKGRCPHTVELLDEETCPPKRKNKERIVCVVQGTVTSTESKRRFSQVPEMW